MRRFIKAIEFLFKDFHFNKEVIDYEEYWALLSQQTETYVPTRFKIIGDMIEEGSSVLDLGCGDGTLLRYLKDTKGIIAKGIDISRTAVELAKRKGIDAEVADIESEKFQISATYDYIVASEVLEHLAKPERVMQKCRGKFLKYLVITVPNTGFIGYRLRLLVGRTPKQWMFHPGEHLRFWSVKDFIFWCSELGFKVESYYGIPEGFLILNLWKLCPGLFSNYILYKIKVSEGRGSLSIEGFNSRESADLGEVRR